MSRPADDEIKKKKTPGGGLSNLAPNGLRGQKTEDLSAILAYTNSGATRNKPITPKLASRIQEAVRNVYGPGYKVQVYSGGQDAKGKGSRRTGSVRHDLGRAADAYIVDPKGNRVTGDGLAPLGQYWAAKKYGGVGLEMRGGGIHLDEWETPPPGGGMAWNYAKQRGQYTPAQREAVQAGLAGRLPQTRGNVSAQMFARNPMLPESAPLPAPKPFLAGQTGDMRNSMVPERSVPLGPSSAPIPVQPGDPAPHLPPARFVRNSPVIAPTETSPTATMFAQANPVTPRIANPMLPASGGSLPFSTAQNSADMGAGLGGGMGAGLGSILSSVASALASGAQSRAQMQADAQRQYEEQLRRSQGPSTAEVAQAMPSQIQGAVPLVDATGLSSQVSPNENNGAMTTEEIMAALFGRPSPKLYG